MAEEFDVNSRTFVDHEIKAAQKGLGKYFQKQQPVKTEKSRYYDKKKFLRNTRKMSPNLSGKKSSQISGGMKRLLSGFGVPVQQRSYPQTPLQKFRGGSRGETAQPRDSNIPSLRGKGREAKVSPLSYSYSRNDIPANDFRQNEQAVEKQELLQQLQQSRMLSPYTAMQLAKIRRIHNKSRSDDAEMQRRIRERRLLSKSMSLMNTPYIFSGNFIDPTREIEEFSILRAPNVFTESANKNFRILGNNGRPTILSNLPENNIMLRRKDSINILAAPNVFKESNSTRINTNVRKVHRNRNSRRR